MRSFDNARFLKSDFYKKIFRVYFGLHKDLLIGNRDIGIGSDSEDPVLTNRYIKQVTSEFLKGSILDLEYSADRKPKEYKRLVLP